MGLPVQWCGLVYADALYWLAVHDSSGPWLRLADGITASAIQQSYPVGSDRLTGLLPDSFNLREQTRNYPAINPGSLFADALRMYRKAPIYDFQVFRSSGLLVHAPGKITHVRDDSGSAVLHVEGWPEEAYHVLVCGLRAAPRSIFINGHALDRKTEAVWDTSRHLLTVNMHGAGTLEIHK
jgi:hypothetical protein